MGEICLVVVFMLKVTWFGLNSLLIGHAMTFQYIEQILFFSQTHPPQKKRTCGIWETRGSRMLWSLASVTNRYHLRGRETPPSFKKKTTEEENIVKRKKREKKEGNQKNSACFPSSMCGHNEFNPQVEKNKKRKEKQ